MKNTMEYKGYIGSVEFSEEDCILYGKVMGIRSLISYEGETAKELLEDETLSIEQIAEQTGYNDYFYFTKVFKKTLGISPSKYRKNYKK